MQTRITARLLAVTLLFSLLIFPDTSLAQNIKEPPRLVYDVNSALTDGSNPSHFMPTSSGETFFFAEDNSGLTGLWKTDGTFDGTKLLRSNLKWGSNGWSYAELQGNVYFSAIDESGQAELWGSDGTSGGTRMVIDLESTYSGDPTYLITHEGKLYFIANLGALYESDGTAAGTKHIFGGIRVHSQMVSYQGDLYAYGQSLWDDHEFFFQVEGTWKDWYSEILPEEYFPRVVVDNLLFFCLTTAENGMELWVTDGSAANTRMVKDINPNGASYPGNFTAYNGILYFTAQDDAHGYELWRSDGTEAGTYLLLETVEGASSSRPAPLAGLSVESGSGRFLFTTSYPTASLWQTDGTTSGTTKVADIAQVSSRDWSVYNDQLYFANRDEAHGMELWVTDGTPEGTGLLIDLNPGIANANPGAPVPCGMAACISGDDGVHGSEIWVTDGLPENTTLLGDLNTNPASSDPHNLTRAGNFIYFFARDAVSDENLWLTDGTEQGTFAVVDDPELQIRDRRDWEITYLYTAAVGDNLFFSAAEPDHGRELWKAGPTPGSAVLVKDMNLGIADSLPQDLTAVGDRLFFTAIGPENSRELYVSDGTVSGTRLVKDLPGQFSPLHNTFAAFGDLLIFPLWSSDGSQLWRSDGTPEGTYTFATVQNLGYVFEQSGQRLFFEAKDPLSANGWLWETDGTAEGTKPVPANDQGGYKYFLHDLTDANGRLFFFWTVSGGHALWTTTGSESGMNLLETFYAMNGKQASVMETANSNGKLAFTVDMFTEGAPDERDTQLWFSDGTPEGTTRLEAGFSSPGNLMAMNGFLFFTASDPENGAQIWRTDGTPEGTQRLSNMPQTFCFPKSTTPWISFTRGSFFFPFKNAEAGCELHAFDYFTRKLLLPAVSR